MKISIITATYNSARTIRDTLKSISSQRYPDIEHIIIDGLSRDNSLEIVKEFKHVSRVISEKDHGIYDAMNKGIRAASGDIIGILNSDDYYTNDSVLEKVAQAFAENEIDAVFGDLQYVDSGDTRKITRTWKAGEFLRNKFFFGWMPPHPTFFVRKQVYDRVGLFNLSLRTAADYELMLRVLLKNNMQAVYIPEVLVKMRAGGASNASLKNRIKANKEDRLAWKMNGLKPYFFTLYLKPLRKIFQWWI